jgi:hypothetical protein
MSTSVPQRKKKAFLAAMAETGNISAAAKIAGIDRHSHYDWLKDDPDGSYAEAYETARIESIESLEKEARRRALTGYLKPVYQGGKKVGTIREFSDTLLIFLLKGAKPETYRDNVHLEIDLRNEAEKVAAEFGLDGVQTSDLIAEAERIAKGA